MTTKKDIMNNAYDGVIVTAFAVATSLVSKKLFKTSLGVPNDGNGAAKLGVAVVIGTVVKDYLQTKDIIPDDPFKADKS